MSKFLEIGIAAAATLLIAVQSAGAQDAAAGEKLFAKCKACHAVGEGAKNRVGPHLNELMGRTAGTVESYRYSKAMAKAGEEGLVWNDETLKTYLTSPKAMVKGTKMAFSGLKDEEDLANMIAYLSTFSTATESAVEPAAEEAAAPEEAAAADVPEAPEAAAEAAAVAEPAAEGAGAHLKLGRPATEEEIAAWDIDVRADGLGLPDGHGTVAEGEVLFDENCASCHGDFGEAVGRWPVLAGGQGTLSDDRPVKTIGSYWPYLSTVFDYTRRAMPFGNARSLSDDDVYALTAYLLYLNDIVTDEEFELSKSNFESVRLPNEANFVDDDRKAEPQYADKTEPCMKDCAEGAAKIIMHAAVLDVTPEAADGDEAPAAGIE
ncbi:c-type cytochrome [Mesorhizobium sp. 10J20-29]